MILHNRSHAERSLRAPLFVSIFSIALMHLVASHAAAGFFILADDNSSIEFDTAKVTEQSNAQNWQVDGVNQLYEQAFWYRVGNAAETSVHSLPIAFELASNTNASAGLDTLFVEYTGPGFDIEIKYSLDGGLAGSGASDLGEQISIINRSGSPLDFHFFQYNDFDVHGTTNGDQGEFTNANTVRQFEGLARLTETVITPVPSHREISPYDSIRDKLTDGIASSLSDLPVQGAVVGPADLTWAFQWDVTIPVGGTFQISKDKNLQASFVPEPSSFAVLALAGLILAWSGQARRLFR